MTSFQSLQVKLSCCDTRDSCLQTEALRLRQNSEQSQRFYPLLGSLRSCLLHLLLTLQLAGLLKLVLNFLQERVGTLGQLKQVGDELLMTTMTTMSQEAARMMMKPEEPQKENEHKENEIANQVNLYLEQGDAVLAADRLFFVSPRGPSANKKNLLCNPLMNQNQ
eukprot:763815-Hanusia_phi.AAC.4